jgi:hypothetical protein
MNSIRTASLPMPLRDVGPGSTAGAPVEHVSTFEYRTRFKRHLELWFDEPEPTGRFDVVTRYYASVRGQRGKSTDFYTLKIDLTKSPDEIFRAFARNTRAQIRKSVDLDDFRFDFLERPGSAELDEFVAFYDAFADSKQLPRLHLPRVLGHLESGFLSLTRVVGQGRTLVWHANVRYQTHVGMMFSASHWRTEDSPESRKMIGRANRRLHWEELLHFKQQGHHSYDFGGWYEGSADQQKLLINRFKEEFGGKKALVFTITEERSLRAKLIAAVNGLRH